MNHKSEYFRTIIDDAAPDGALKREVDIAVELHSGPDGTNADLVVSERRDPRTALFEVLVKIPVDPGQMRALGSELFRASFAYDEREEEHRDLLWKVLRRQFTDASTIVRVKDLEAALGPMAKQACYCYDDLGPTESCTCSPCTAKRLLGEEKEQS